MGTLRLTLGAAALLSLSGTIGADPRTPPPPPGHPSPYLGVALVGSGGPAAAVDTYGQLVDVRARPAGEPVVAVPAARLRYGTVPAASAAGVRVAAGREPLPLWRGTGHGQRYRPGTNVLVTSARVAGARVRIEDAASGGTLLRRVTVRTSGQAPRAVVEVPADAGCRATRSGGPSRLVVELICAPGGGGNRTRSVAAELRRAAAADRRWLARAEPLGDGAPGWARRLHRRSLLVLRASKDATSGALAAGARDRWSYVWPRDAAAAAIALATAGYRAEAWRIAHFLARLDLDAAARFEAGGSPAAGRDAAGDAEGWARAAARAAGLDRQGAWAASRAESTTDSESAVGADPVPGSDRWRDLEDYAENDPGDLLANAIAAGAPASEILERFEEGGRLVRGEGVRSAGLDSAAAWAVAPFGRPELHGAARRTLVALAAGAGPFGIQPTSDWPGRDAWTAPTAWSAWALARLGEDRLADRLLAALRRAATPAGLLPERVHGGTGLPVSTTPLAWSHAIAILALRDRFG